MFAREGAFTIIAYLSGDCKMIGEICEKSPAGLGGDANLKSGEGLFEKSPSPHPTSKTL